MTLAELRQLAADVVEINEARAEAAHRLATERAAMERGDESALGRGRAAINTYHGLYDKLLDARERLHAVPPADIIAAIDAATEGA